MRNVHLRRRWVIYRSRISPGVSVLFNQQSAGLRLSGQETTHFIGHEALGARCLINPAL